MGLRERKKERTRDQLAAAAIALFIERGYDATTVDDIAAAIDVSPRTFFRYYPTKEDVAVELLRAGVLDLQDALAARPAEEPLPDALRAALRHWAESAGGRAAQMRQLHQLLGTAPRLRARLDQERKHTTEVLSRLIATRLGVDTAADPRPEMITFMIAGVISCAIDRWVAADCAQPLADVVDSGFDMLCSGLPSSPCPMAAGGQQPQDLEPVRGDAVHAQTR